MYVILVRKFYEPGQKLHSASGGIITPNYSDLEVNNKFYYESHHFAARWLL